MWTNTTQQLIQGVMQHGPDILSHCVTADDLSQYVNRLNQEHLNYPIPPADLDCTEWFIPKEYQRMDIEEFVVSQCPKQNYDRLIQELDLYKSHNLLPVLRAMKYIVDTLRNNNIVWGVGRGSSVASYVLFIIGVHKIDSVKYKLPINEFFKGD
jgi:DNA polymerase III alpha subunit